MVRPRIFFPLFSLLALCAAVAPASADGLLQGLENEVASVVNRTKKAVVSIYDERLIMPTMRVEAPPAGSRADEARLRDYGRQMAALDKRIARLQDRIKTGESKPDELESLQNKRSDLEEEMKTFQKDVPNTLKDATYLAWQANNIANLPKSGTGFSIGDGYVVTTADVLEGMRNPVIVADDGRRIKAHIAGIEPELNIGLLQFSKRANLPALEIGDSNVVAVGQFAISIGNQNGQDNSVALVLVGGVRSEGVSSGSHYYPGLIQIAGTVGAGASGAPLVNSHGQVIGMLAAVPPAGWTFGYTTPSLPHGVRGPGSGNGHEPPKPSPGDPPDVLNPAPSTDPDTAPQAPFGDQAINFSALLQGVTADVSQLPGLSSTDKSDKVGRGGQATAPAVRAPRTGQAPNRNFFGLGQAQPAMPFFFQPPPVTSAGYAIPINDIKPVVEDLRTGEKRPHGWIGIVTNDDTKWIDEGDGIMHCEYIVQITSVIPDSPAQRGGIQSGDYLVSLDDRPINKTSEIRGVVIRLRAGDSLSAVVKRANNVRKCNLKIDARPADTSRR